MCVLRIERRERRKKGRKRGRERERKKLEYEEFRYLNPSPQGDGIMRRWGVWEVIKS